MSHIKASETAENETAAETKNARTVPTAKGTLPSASFNFNLGGTLWGFAKGVLDSLAITRPLKTVGVPRLFLQSQT